MLFLLFQIGSERYALEARHAVEVIPLVPLQRPVRAEGNSRGVAGVFNYRGQAVTAVDLSQLTLGKPAPELLSTRIIVVNFQDARGAWQWAGLIAERATGLLRQDGVPVAGKTPATNPASAATSITSVLTDELGVVQLLLPERVLAGCFQAARN